MPDKTIKTHLTQAPTGMAGHFLHDSSANPYDLRPALTACTQMIGKAANQLLPDQKLIVIFGEFHNFPTNRILQTKLSTELHNTFGDRLLIALEMNHEMDRTHHHPALQFNAGFNAGPSPYAHAYLYHTLYQNNIPTCFNDASKTGINNQPHIDIKDIKTGNFIKENFSKFNGKTLHIKDPDAMNIRGSFMAHTALTKAYKDNHDIIFQSTGQAHVFGRQDLKFGDSHYKQNLCHHFKIKSKKGKPEPVIIPIIPLHNKEEEEKNIFECAKKHSGPVLFLEGIGSESYNSDIKFMIFNHRNVASPEQNFVEKIWKESGGEQSGLPKPKLFNHYKREAKQVLERTP